MTDKGKTIADGDFIKLDYVGRVKDSGMIFDLTREDVAKKEGLDDDKTKFESVVVVVGAGHVLKGLDEQLKSMKIGDKKKVVITPGDGFGERSTELLKLVPMNVFKKQNMKPMPGMPVELQGQRGVVKTVSGGRVRVDFNHPLAGKELEYDIEIHEKLTKSEDQIKGLFGVHLPNTDFKDLRIEIKSKEVEITTPDDEKIRRYINLTENTIAKDILKYIKDIDKVKFVDIFEK